MIVFLLYVSINFYLNIRRMELKSTHAYGIFLILLYGTVRKGAGQGEPIQAKQGLDTEPDNPAKRAGEGTGGFKKESSRQHPRQEPGALVAHAGICAGGAGQPAFLPRRKPLSINMKCQDKDLILKFLYCLVNPCPYLATDFLLTHNNHRPILSSSQSKFLSMAVPELERALRDEDQLVSSHAAWALEKINGVSTRHTT
jgi:hypothetical protein